MPPLKDLYYSVHIMYRMVLLQQTLNANFTMKTKTNPQDSYSNPTPPALSPNKKGKGKTIDIRSFALLKRILEEHPKLSNILKYSVNEDELLNRIQSWIQELLPEESPGFRYYRGEARGHEELKKLSGRDIAAIRILDYIDHKNMELSDPNLRGGNVLSNPLGLLWLAVKKSTNIASADFFEDMRHLFNQLSGQCETSRPTQKKLMKWMEKHPSGLQPEIIQQREVNRRRILNHIIDKIEAGEKRDPKYRFEEGLTRKQQLEIASEWWKEHRFHLRFAVRTPRDLNRMLNNSLEPKTMAVLFDAEKKGIPFFINPYYLSLLQPQTDDRISQIDHTIRDYIIYNRQLVDEFGQISAWEKEDISEPGRPNAAGWITPGKNIHRRYPEVAILIPDTMGRACGGLCSVCQRMYGFQKGNLNFNLEKLAPKESWNEKLKKLMDYFEHDSQLQDVLVTGGDAFMSSNGSLKSILAAVLEMANRKREKNRLREIGDKHAEITRIRLGTRLPVYLPQRITTELLEILAEFKEKAAKIGVKQFVIQTHFVSPLEVTPEAKKAIRKLLTAGWIVTNQMVFTTAASRRGHAAKLRRVLNEIGVLPYYTFSVKGFMENNRQFATNARIVQEQMEEKVFGAVLGEDKEWIRVVAQQPETLDGQLAEFAKSRKLPFLSTDRSVLNMPGVGKSLTFRVVGITKTGRRILRFDHDGTRNHSPIINQLGKVFVVESKSIAEYLRQLKEMNEDPTDYESIFGYSIGETESRMPIYDYPESDLQITARLTNFSNLQDKPGKPKSLYL